MVQNFLANNAIHAGVILGPENKVPNNNEITDLKLVYDNEVVDKWIDKKWPFDMLGEIEWLVKDKAKTKNILKKNRFNFNRCLWISCSN